MAGLIRILLAAAAIAVVAPASAGENPRAKAPKPEPAEGRLIPCPQYGPGFYRTEGSTVCLKVGGRVRGEIGARRSSSLRPDDGMIRGLAELGGEARKETDYGPFRAVVRIRGIGAAGGGYPSGF